MRPPVVKGQKYPPPGHGLDVRWRRDLLDLHGPQRDHGPACTLAMSGRTPRHETKPQRQWSVPGPLGGPRRGTGNWRWSTTGCAATVAHPERSVHGHPGPTRPAFSPLDARRARSGHHGLDAVAVHLGRGAYDVMDGFPIPVAHGARSFHPGWLADIARSGKGGNDRYFYGVRMMMVVNQQGVATGWALASGNVQERWVAERLFSIRAGVPRVQGPLDAQGHSPS